MKVDRENVKVGDYITIRGFRTEGSGIVSRIEITKRHVSGAGIQEDYVFFHVHTSMAGNTREIELASVPFGFVMKIDKLN